MVYDKLNKVKQNAYIPLDLRYDRLHYFAQILTRTNTFSTTFLFYNSQIIKSSILKYFDTKLSPNVYFLSFLKSHI